jgi:hypothetical protein
VELYTCTGAIRYGWSITLHRAPPGLVSLDRAPLAANGVQDRERVRAPAPDLFLFLFLSPSFSLVLKGR